MPFSKTMLVSAAVLGSAAAYPYAALSTRQQQNGTSSGNSSSTSYPYMAPGPNDSRGPCPALNTLANHGYISRDGRNMTSDMILDGFSNGFGIANSAVLVPLKNFYTICEYVEGQECSTLTNLTLLAEPHAFEHEHSLSREDYHMSYSNGAINDNNNFNSTIFAGSLNVVGNNTHMDFALAQEVRLERESFSLGNDLPGWFIEARDLALTEMGWVFAAMADPSLPDADSNPQVRVDWWNYWFTNESLPTALGWTKPNPPRDAAFVSSVSSMVQNAPVTSTPSPLPAVALMSVSFGHVNVTASLSTVFALPTNDPENPATFTVASVPAAVTSSAAASTTPLSPSQSSAAASLASFHQRLADLESSLGPEPTAFNLYTDLISRDQVAAQVNARQARLDTVQSVLSASM